MRRPFETRTRPRVEGTLQGVLRRSEAPLVGDQPTLLLTQPAMLNDVTQSLAPGLRTTREPGLAASASGALAVGHAAGLDLVGGDRSTVAMCTLPSRPTASPSLH